MGDGRQERALNKTGFKAAVLCCHSLEKDRRGRHEGKGVSEV